MLCSLQKASMWNRISAFLVDMILISIAAVGLALLLSTLLGYDSCTDRLQASYAKYESEYAVDFDISANDYEALSEAQRQVYDDALKALSSDDSFLRTYSILINLTLVIITLSTLISYLIFEFAIPLLLHNGQSVGKKIFGIGVMRVDGVKLSPLLLFIRTVLGKYTIETMLPVLIVIMIYFNAIGLAGTCLIFLLVAIQLVLLVATQARTPIHDKLAQTVTVDIASQMIFESKEAMLDYKQRLHAEEAHRTEG